MHQIHLDVVVIVLHITIMKGVDVQPSIAMLYHIQGCHLCGCGAEAFALGLFTKFFVRVPNDAISCLNLVFAPECPRDVSKPNDSTEDSVIIIIEYIIIYWLYVTSQQDE